MNEFLLFYGLWHVLLHVSTKFMKEFWFLLLSTCAPVILIALRAVRNPLFLITNPYPSMVQMIFGAIWPQELKYPIYAKAHVAHLDKDFLKSHVTFEIFSYDVILFNAELHWQFSVLGTIRYMSLIIIK
jgi:hypothetical protein